MSKSFDYPRERTLAGGFAAVLTAAEANAWHDYVEQTEAYGELEAATLDAASLEMRMVSGATECEDGWRDAKAREKAALAALYELAKVWVAALPPSQ